ncbi:hypothetical protein GCK72_022232 [Caenorhabditis remanei]|uniref:Phosphatidylinositol 4-kinase beta n=1 Tax=Caenorhabditis remanei TaxID=31234 RepID=A0A6A5FTF6_CAERE|nr:hypothetical protein GCK72_022232 [Caenorhabditis remanei]KAF1745785.1 hypothetical protein GCK72_022232 [Caenorhabditis remanei]
MKSENDVEYTIKQPDLKDASVPNAENAGKSTDEMITAPDDDIEKEDDGEIEVGKENSIKPTHDRQSWTIRLLSSDSFDASMAVEYLNSIQDKPSLTFLGKRLFDLPEKDLDFYLPQLMYLYVTKVDAASVSHAYIEERHKNDAQFTVLCIWLLNCFTRNVPNKYENHALMLKSLLSKTNSPGSSIESMNILSLDRLEETNWTVGSTYGKYNGNFYHSEVQSQSTALNATLDSYEKPRYGPISSQILTNQQNFIGRLVFIGVKLTQQHLFSSKQEKTIALQSELNMLNSMLPTAVWIPFDFENTIFNICVDESAVLNSKDKVPYVFFAEVVRSSPHYNNVKTPASLDQKMKRSQSESILLKNKSYHDSTDPSIAVFAESWAEKKSRIRGSSRYENHQKWDLIPVIVKTGDDLSQEAFAQQLLFTFKDLWQEEGVPLYLRPYKIVCIGSDAGLIEPVLDTLSLHQIKRHLTNLFRMNGNPATPLLKHHFENVFGPVNSETYVNAQKNFIQSTAAYSLVSYYLQLKDRHNGNILLDMEGHLIHIDYGFLLSSSPRNLGFETAPFKLTTEIIDVMGGIDSDMFLYFKSLLLRGLMAARKHHRRIVSLAEIMSSGSKMQCFRAGAETVRALEARFHVSSTDEQLQQLVDTLVEGSRDSYTTRFYDSFQYYTNGIH